MEKLSSELRMALLEVFCESVYTFAQLGTILLDITANIAEPAFCDRGDCHSL